MAENETQNRRPFWQRRGPVTIIGLILLGLLISILGSTLYDLLLKPGLTSFGRFILDVVTLGSATLRDAAYSSAALDPTPLSALLLLITALVIVLLVFFLTALYPVINLVAKVIVARGSEAIVKALSEAPEGQTKNALNRELGKLERKFLSLYILIWVLILPSFAAAIVALNVHNQSVLIWRAFHADIAILTPYIAPSEKDQMIAQFAAMETSNDYQVIRDRMNALAKERGVKIRNIETW